MYNRKNFQYLEPPKKFTLNITSMADMFTILLVFLLQNYSLSEVKLEPIPGLNLPVSSSFTHPRKLPIIYLTKENLKVDNEILLESKELYQSNKQIDKLYQTLIKIKSNLPDIAKNSEEIILQADKNHSYEIIQKIMYTSLIAGFPKLKLATLSGE